MKKKLSVLLATMLLSSILTLSFIVQFASARPLVHDIAVISVTASPTTAWGGEPVYINVTVENQGNFTETFDVTVYADKNMTVVGDEIFVGNQTVYSLPPGATQTLNFVWNTTGAPSGSYNISAHASEVPHEKDIDDNWLIGAARVGGVWGAMPGPKRAFKPQLNVTAMLVPWGLVILYLVILAIMAVGFFIKILMSVRLRWPWHLSKRTLQPC